MVTASSIAVVLQNIVGSYLTVSILRVNTLCMFSVTNLQPCLNIPYTFMPTGSMLLLDLHATESSTDDIYIDTVYFNICNTYLQVQQMTYVLTQSVLYQ